MTNASNVLWYSRPAKTWVHSLLLGNGSLGGAFYGRVQTETIELNLDTIWAGYPGRRGYSRENPYEAFKKAQELSLQGKNFEAQEIIEKEFSGGDSQHYLPLGKLIISSKSNLKQRNYKRQLDLKTALYTVDYKLKKTEYHTEAFISHPHDVLVMKTVADGDVKINLSLTFQNEMRHTVTTDGEFLRLQGTCPSENPMVDGKFEDVYLDGDKKGVDYLALASFDSDGKIKFNKNNVSIKDATFLTIYLGADSSFVDFESLPNKEYISPCEEKLRVAKATAYSELKDAHIKDYQNLYNRVELDLGNGKKENTVTSTRLLEFLRNKNDIELYTLLFNFGRYLAISSSRKGTQAMNLQGIWTYQKFSPWRSNYTVNINTEMNYWPLLACSMPELCQPLNNFVVDLSKAGQWVAKELYNARGFTCHHNVDLWRHSTPVSGRACWLFWNMSGAWLTRHLFEYYEYTKDLDFLKNTAFPVLIESAKFCLDILVEDENGYLIACPSTSPENHYIDKNKNEVSVSQTTTMTMSIIEDNFRNALLSGEILGSDDPVLDEIKEALPKLLPLRIGKDGRLLEWYNDEKDEEIHHRHVSHLYGLFPANLIDVDRTPELTKAAQKTLDVRGDNGTGWSLGWKINFHARLRNGNRALKLINNQLRYIPNPQVRGRGGTYPNMLDAHSPFQIDGNFGAVSGIVQMLVQSFENRVLILPALPENWADGSVKGITVKGGAVISIKWKDGKLASLTAKGEGEYEFIYGDKKVKATLNGKEQEIELC